MISSSLICAWTQLHGATRVAYCASLRLVLRCTQGCRGGLVAREPVGSCFLIDRKFVIAFFIWVIPWSLNFICRRFGTLYLYSLFKRAMKMEQTGCFETSTHKIQTSGDPPKGKNTTFTTRRMFEIKSFLLSSECHTLCNYQRTEKLVFHLDFSSGSHIFFFRYEK